MITRKGVAGTCKTQQSQAERQQRRRKRRKLSFALKTNNPPNLNVFFFFNENTSLYSDNPVCNYSFSILYYQEPKL